MQLTLIVIHVIISVLLIGVILIQKSNSDGLSGLASGNNTNLGLVSARSAGNILTKITYILTVLFMANCLLIGNLSTKSAKKKSIIDEIERTEKNEHHKHHEPVVPIIE